MGVDSLALVVSDRHREYDDFDRSCTAATQIHTRTITQHDPSNDYLAISFPALCTGRTAFPAVSIVSSWWFNVHSCPVVSYRLRKFTVSFFQVELIVPDETARRH
jgi:hypothetical protein